MTEENKYPDFNPKIRVHNDQKEKWQSFTATVDIQITGDLYMGLIEAYGSTHEESKDNLVGLLDNVINELQEKRDLIKQHNLKD